ncbi:hypothetical protein F4778DRAFT_379542 [Xylariomycetidae sp. FL2044]|nr:hypothetical protein F4778DRAFT_379542 [Xylariomycetidae sp. FL2044]
MASLSKLMIRADSFQEEPDPIGNLWQLSRANPKFSEWKKLVKTFQLCNELMNAADQYVFLLYRLKESPPIRDVENTWWGKNHLHVGLGWIIPTKAELMSNAIRHECPHGVRRRLQETHQPSEIKDKILFQLHQAAWDIFPLLQWHFSQIHHGRNIWFQGQAPAAVSHHEECLLMHYLSTVMSAIDLLEHVHSYSHLEDLEKEAKDPKSEVWEYTYTKEPQLQDTAKKLKESVRHLKQQRTT